METLWLKNGWDAQPEASPGSLPWSSPRSLGTPGKKLSKANIDDVLLQVAPSSGIQRPVGGPHQWHRRVSLQGRQIIAPHPTLTMLLPFWKADYSFSLPPCHQTVWIQATGLSHCPHVPRHCHYWLALRNFHWAPIFPFFIAHIGQDMAPS